MRTAHHAIAVADATAGVLASLWPAIASAQQQSEDAKNAIRAQADRAGVTYKRGRAAHYTDKFDLSGLPHYEPKDAD